MNHRPLFRSGLTVAAALAWMVVAALAPEAAAAQSSVRLLPQVGGYAPLSELGEIREDGVTVLEAGRRASSLAWGLGLEFGPAREGTSLRLHAAYGTDSRIPVGGFECQGCSARSTLLAASAAAVLRPIPRLVFLQPYVLVGAGVKRYDFSVSDMEGERWRDLFRDQSRASAQAGLGAEVSLLGLRTQWELNAYISRYELGTETGSDSDERDDELQTDLFFTLAIPLGG